MSFSNPNVELTYNGNGSDDTFGVNFTYLEGETSSIAVELWDYTDPDLPVQQSFVLNVDYTIDESGYPATNVVTTLPVPVDFKIFIYRNTPKMQPSNFVNGSFPAESVEEAIDRIAFIGQENAAKLDRVIINPIGGPELDTTTILSYESRITQNETDIAQNADDIAQNAADIAAISGDTVVILATDPTTHAATDGEIIIVKESNITINLPTPDLGVKVRVKMDGDRSGVTVNHASGIDGFGSTYTLSSIYESLSLVADGTQWYIF